MAANYFGPIKAGPMPGGKSASPIQAAMLKRRNNSVAKPNPNQAVQNTPFPNPVRSGAKTVGSK